MVFVHLLTPPTRRKRARRHRGPGQTGQIFGLCPVGVRCSCPAHILPGLSFATDEANAETGESRSRGVAHAGE